VIALFWNDDGFVDPRVEAAYTAAYDRRGIEIRSVHAELAHSSEPDKVVDQERPDGWPEVHAEAGQYFTELRTHRYEWTSRMSVADYVACINTTSAHLILSPETRDDLTAELTATLAGYGDEIELAMTTALATAVRR
jgi:hypothetical protein